MNLRPWAVTSLTLILGMDFWIWDQCKCNKSKNKAGGRAEKLVLAREAAGTTEQQPEEDRTSARRAMRELTLRTSPTTSSNTSLGLKTGRRHEQTFLPSGRADGQQTREAALHIAAIRRTHIRTAARHGLAPVTRLTS